MKKMSTKKAQPKADSGTAELLLEIGVEELPYQFIAPALSSLIKETAFSFGFHRLPDNDSIKVYGTPRRLVLVVERLAIHQEVFTNETMGPSKSVAYDQAGQPTKAAIGFARGQGVSVESLRVRQTPRGEYLFAVKEDAGRPTKTVLLEILPQIVGELSFPKAMKWNESGVRFARPVRWLVALFAGKPVPVEIAGIQAGDRTYGHRVLGGGKPITVRGYNTYSRALERAGVVVDPERRRTLIQEQILQLCGTAGVGLNVDDALLDQAVFTTEWPYAVLGSFKSEYLAVPSEILMTSMKEHQGFFSVRDKKSGRLAPHFIAVANNQPKDMSLIRAGNERVLAARLADAKFFFDEDRKVKLEERVKKLAGVTFHQKLGTMAQKQIRVGKLAGLLAAQVSSPFDELKSVCERAAALCKADLLTGVVREFPELQGIMGGEYAKHDGEDDAVSLAIREQYLPRSIEGALPETLAGKILSLADQLDSVVAFFHVGLVPTGSEDPFALRRNATAIVRIILEGNLRLVDLETFVKHARTSVIDDGFKGVAGSEQEGYRRIVEFLFERLRHYGRLVHSLRDDVMDAVLKAPQLGIVDLVDLLEKMNALQAITERPEFDPLMIGFKRAHRLVTKEKWEPVPVNPALFQHPSEITLHKAWEENKELVKELLVLGKYSEPLEALVCLKPAIDAFFEAVMVNADDPTIRGNRLSLLKDVDELFMLFADFSQIVIQGG